MQMVGRCRAAGAEVILCTPNSIYEGDAARPTAGLAAYAETVRQVGREAQVPVADCHAAYEAIRARDPRAWMGLMSETIHPNMRGHKVFAEEVARVISGRDVSLGDVPPLRPGFPHCLERLAGGHPLRVTAMCR
jgi:lysophospholipase L1-like esterase